MHGVCSCASYPTSYFSSATPSVRWMTMIKKGTNPCSPPTMRIAQVARLISPKRPTLAFPSSFYSTFGLLCFAQVFLSFLFWVFLVSSKMFLQCNLFNVCFAFCSFAYIISFSFPLFYGKLFIMEFL